MRTVALAILAVAGCCATPPRIDDRSTARRGYETFRGALARGEIDREFASFTDRLQRQLGVASPAEWDDVRAVVLRRRHPLVRGIVCSRVRAVREIGPDRAELEIDLPLGHEGRVGMRRLVVLRIWVRDREGRVQARVDQILPRLRVRAEGGVLRVPLPPGLAADIDEMILSLEAEGITKVELAREWFLDDFQSGGETPESVKRQRQAVRPGRGGAVP
ncbi:MAG: hypothetical protein ACE5JG_00540 [Planctomycetota bacterium]